jgi:hypothetical protein
MAMLGVVATLLLTPAAERTFLLWGSWAVWRALTTAQLVLLPGLLLTSCAPRPLTLSLALQARVVVLADRLAARPVDLETGQPTATVLLAGGRARVAAPPPAPSGPPLWVPGAPKEVSNVP